MQRSSLGVPDLASVRRVCFEPVPARTRKGAAPREAWRLALEWPGGRGAIVLVVLAEGVAHHRGEGGCLGWPRERLAATYEAFADALQPRERAG